MSVSRQMLVYQATVALSPSRHADLSIEATTDYSFAAELNAVPLTAVEFARAAQEYAIVLAQGGGGELVPAALVGVRPGENLFVAPDRSWRGRYVPAFLRRHPFVFASADADDRLTLCIDEACRGLNREGRGERLFTSDGRPTVHLEERLHFVQAYQTQAERTRRFMQRVQTLDLLEPMHLQAQTDAAGATRTLGGFMGVSRERLRALDAPTLQALAANDELELLYLQLNSLHNLDLLKTRLAAAVTDTLVCTASA